MTIELENNSAPSFIKFLDDRDIVAVGFDLDNTLMNTDIYYYNTWDLISEDISKFLNTGKSAEEVGVEYKKVLNDRFSRRGNKPENVVDESVNGLEEYLGYMTEELRNILINRLIPFYNTSPNPYDSVYEILKILNDNEKKIVFCSHAQDSWTRVKVDLLGKELEKDLPYVAVDIDRKKDSLSWIESVNLIGTDISKTLVIGDSLESDILSAIEAGCKHVIWVDRQGNGLPSNIQIPEDVELIIVKNIREIMEI